MNLMLAVLWLLAAATLFAIEWSTGKPVLRVRSLDISSAWLLLALGCYNLVRWFSIRAARAEREAMVSAYEARLRHARRPMPTQPDPTFDFTAKPPNVRPPSDAPPAAN